MGFDFPSSTTSIQRFLKTYLQQSTSTRIHITNPTNLPHSTPNNKMASSPSTYLVTGAARGIGFGLVETLVQRPGVTVFAAIRDIAKKDGVEKLNAKAAQGSKVVAIQIRAGDDDDAKAIPKTLSENGVDHLDVVIANAGISNYYGLATETPLAQFREHFEVNTIGFVSLFQAVFPFLDKSENPKFVYVSSGLFAQSPYLVLSFAKICQPLPP